MPSKHPLRADFIAVDTGSGRICAHNAGGPVKIPEIKSLQKIFHTVEQEYRLEVGATQQTVSASERKLLTLAYLLSISDVVMESATIGSHGFKTETCRKVIREAPHRLYKVTGHLVKNQLKYEGHGRTTSDISDAQAAEIIYKEVARQPKRVALYREEKAPPFRYSTVRPMDEFGYDCYQARHFMARLDGYAPQEPGVTMKPAQVIQFAMSMDEYFAEGDRNRWFGAFGQEHRKGSFYSRAYIDLADDITEAMFGVETKAQVTKQQRRAGQSAARRELRRMFDYMKPRVETPVDVKRPSLQATLFEDAEVWHPRVT